MDELPVPSRCPSCSSPKVAVIRYGLMDVTPELLHDLAEGKVVLGGCCVSDGDPRWKCKACGHNWGELKFDFEYFAGQLNSSRGRPTQP